MDMHSFLRKIPKVDLHVHLEGSVQPTTFVELAAKHDVKLPPHKTPEDLYSFPTILDFLVIYAMVGQCVKDHDDFRRIAYETLKEGHEHGVRYREMFWSPMDHLEFGVPYKTAVDGVIEGIHDAEKDFGITCRLIADINRMKPPEAGYEMVETVLANPREELIGIGLDYAEANDPPEKFWKAYRLAAKGGLHLTAHACEDAPARNVETCLDLLGCERIDHGYHVLEDERITRRCRDEGVVFTTCVVSTHLVYFPTEFSEHPVRKMKEAGLKIMLNSDDPPMCQTNPSLDYIMCADHMEFTPEDFKELVMNGVDGCWLPDPKKRQLRREWGAEIDAMIASLDR
jgi:adenosine deaminase